MKGCPCRSCRSARFGYFGYRPFPGSTDDSRLERARRSFLEEPVKWGPQLYTVEWFEREVDEILGVTHQRFLTGLMRDEIPALTPPVAAATVVEPTRD